MHIVTLLEELDLSIYLGLFLVFLLLGLASFKHLTFAWCDPAWLVPISSAIIISLTSYTWFFLSSPRGEAVVYQVCAYGAFLVGATIVCRILGFRRANDIRQFRRPEVIFLDVSAIKVFTGLCQLLLIVLLLFRAKTQGLPIFAEDPELAKVMVNQEGFGLVTRLLGPLTYLSVACGFLLFTLGAIRGWRLMGYLLIPVLALLVTASKSAFLVMIFAIVSVLVYGIRFFRRSRITQISIWWLIAGGILAFSYVFLVLALRGYGANGDNIIDYIASTFGLRLLATADGNFYYFGNGLEHSFNYGPLDYFWSHLVVPIFGVLRLVDYPKRTLGLEISWLMFQQELLGPLPTMYVEGDVYFGRVGGIGYCFLLGCAFSLLRLVWLRRKVRGNFLNFLLFSSSLFIVVGIPADMLVFMGDLINFSFVVFFLFVVAVLVTYIVRTIDSKPIALGNKI